MGLNCRIRYTAKGEAVALNEDGTPSDLYQEALALTGEQETALNMWAITTLDRFKETLPEGVTEEDITLDQLQVMYKSIKASKGRLTALEKVHVKSMLSKNGFYSLSEFLEKVVPIFRKDGITKLNTVKALKSGLYTAEDLQNVNLPKVSDLLDRMEGQLEEEDIQAIPDSSDVYYHDPKNKNVMGMSEKINEKDIDDILKDTVEDFTSFSEFYDRVSELPYREFVEKFQDNRFFSEKYFAKFEGMQNIPVYNPLTETLVKRQTGTETLVRNTIPSNIPTTSLEADIRFLSRVNEDVWEDRQDQVKKVIREVEREMSRMGIDIIGLSNRAKNKEKVIDFLQTVKIMAKDPSSQNIEVFAKKYDSLFGVKTERNVVRLPKSLRGLTILKTYSNLSPKALFSRYGLIKVGDDIYHKVNKDASTEELHNIVIDKVLEGKLALPIEITNLDITDRTSFANKISNYFKGKDTGLGFKDEMVSLYQTLFEHPSVAPNKERDTRQLSLVQTNANYLQTDFVEDFYKYMLKEKYKNSEVYRNVLSKISIEDNDIVVKSSVDSFEGIEYQAELMDYFRLSKKESLKKYLPDTPGAMLENNIALNFPELLKDYEGQAIVKGDFIFTPTQQDGYIRYQEKAYKKLGDRQGNSLYQRVDVRTNPNFYNITSEEGAPKAFVNQLLDMAEQLDFKKTRQTSIQNQKNVSTLNTLFDQQISTDKILIDSSANLSKVLGRRLVQYFQSKGIAIETNPVITQQEMDKLGVNDNYIISELSGVKRSTIGIQLFEEEDRIRVTTHGDKIKTTAQMRAVSLRTFNTIRAGLQEVFKGNYNASYVVIEENRWFTDIKINMPEYLKQVYRDSKLPLSVFQEEQRIMKASLMRKATIEAMETARKEEELENEVTNLLPSITGEMLGFERGGKIFIDSNKLSDVSTIHEAIHVFQKLVELRASKGDSNAKSIIEKRRNLFREKAQEWYKYHEKISQEMPSTDDGPNLSYPVYRRRETETLRGYQARLENEIEAYTVSPKFANQVREKFQEDPEAIIDKMVFISKMNDWVAEQMGLEQPGKPILEMTIQEYSQALGESVIKADYQVLAEEYQNFLRNESEKVSSSPVEILLELEESEQEEIATNITMCG